MLLSSILQYLRLQWHSLSSPRLWRLHFPSSPSRHPLVKSGRASHFHRASSFVVEASPCKVCAAALIKQLNIVQIYPLLKVMKSGEVIRKNKGKAFLYHGTLKRVSSPRLHFLLTFLLKNNLWIIQCTSECVGLLDATSKIFVRFIILLCCLAAALCDELAVAEQRDNTTC